MLIKYVIEKITKIENDMDKLQKSIDIHNHNGSYLKMENYNTAEQFLKDKGYSFKENIAVKMLAQEYYRLKQEKESILDIDVPSITLESVKGEELKL